MHDVELLAVEFQRRTDKEAESNPAYRVARDKRQAECPHYRVFKRSLLCADCGKWLVKKNITIPSQTDPNPSAS